MPEQIRLKNGTVITVADPTGEPMQGIGVDFTIMPVDDKRLLPLTIDEMKEIGILDGPWFSYDPQIP